MANKTSKRLIDWEYCECGCKGFVFSIADHDFWCWLRLSEPYSFQLNHGHGWYGTQIGVYKSFEEVDQAVVDFLKVNGTMEELENELKKIKRLLKNK